VTIVVEVSHMATARKTQAAYRQAQAVEMMLAGKDFDTIAEELGYATRSGAWRAGAQCPSSAKPSRGST
jgi:hypothetical protein